MKRKIVSLAIGLTAILLLQGCGAKNGSTKSNSEGKVSTESNKDSDSKKEGHYKLKDYTNLNLLNSGINIENSGKAFNYYKNSDSEITTQVTQVFFMIVTEDGSAVTKDNAKDYVIESQDPKAGTEFTCDKNYGTNSLGEVRLKVKRVGGSSDVEKTEQSSAKKEDEKPKESKVDTPTKKEDEKSKEPKTDTPAVTAPVFSPTDVSNKTIESIRTYNDYLAMYYAIIQDYLANYEEAIKDTALYSPDSMEDMKKQYETAYEEQKKEYASMGNKKLVGKNDLVKFLKDYRDGLKEMTNSVKESLK
ncbi:hypothetical protein [Floricoccus penangensis]|uniref:hypothetical protein n=1 Tax=Floricoccus penangensis TaxID=1859475 RepID=UPI00203FCF21|nr:hypothetical protein [Floricoccus penangensis]URZ88118.1 hypothetical protein KIW23_03545 [Floricoccus penangensis]